MNLKKLFKLWNVSLLLICLCGITACQSKINIDIEQQADEYLIDLANEDEFSGSVLIAHQGEIVFKKGYGYADKENEILNSPQTKFQIASITKQITALAILQLQEQGKLAVQDPACEYISGCPSPWEEITIHHLLTHSSGLPPAMGFGLEPSNLVEGYQDVVLDFKPGEDFQYSNVGYMVLGLVIENVSGQTYENYLQENIFEPLNLSSTGLTLEDNDIAVGYNPWGSEAPVLDPEKNLSAAGLYSTVEDLFALWDQIFHDNNLITEDSLSSMVSASNPIPPDQLTLWEGDWAYGYAWFVGEENGRGIYTHGGIAQGISANISYYPEQEITIIILSNREDAPKFDIQAELSKQIFGE